MAREAIDSGPSGEQALPVRESGGFYQERVDPIVRYGRRNPSLLVGLGMLLGLLLFVVIGTLAYPNMGDGVSGGAPVRDKSHSPSWCTWCDKWAEY